MPIGEWVLREACREAASWPKPLHIAVNLSPMQFRHGDLPELVHSVLLETGLAASRLELEITEGVLIDDFSRALSILRRLKALGVRIAMDDFGTGYSSLSYLQSFPFDKIKIDRTFISNVETQPPIGRDRARRHRARARPRSAGDRRRRRDRRTSSPSCRAKLCDEVQGYLVGRPQPIACYGALIGGETLPQPEASKPALAASAS